MVAGERRGILPAMQVESRPVGHLLREWRERRRLSQLELALDAEISARHVSFLETGRSSPSREMLLRLAARLDVPLRERNALLLAAGYAPAFRERPLSDPALAGARLAIERLIAAHEPFPALAVDRHWTMIAANKAALRLTSGVSPALLEPPVNVLRLSLHPDGAAPRIANLAAWRSHVFARLAHQVEVTADATLAELLRELLGYPAPQGGDDAGEPAANAVVVPLQLVTPAGVLSLISTTTVFGTPMDVTISELALETFFPADEASATLLRDFAQGEPVMT